MVTINKTTTNKEIATLLDFVFKFWKIQKKLIQIPDKFDLFGGHSLHIQIYPYIVEN